MVFSTIPFMYVYLPIVLAIYYIAPVKWRNVWLFIVNLVFYGWGEPIYLFLMLFSITTNYFFGMLIGKYHGDRKKAKFYLILNTVMNLALLIFFKYIDLIIVSLAHIPMFSHLQPLHVALPIGISFYTFQSISYGVDIYREDASVQKNFIAFGTYISLFPQLVAGPIVRYKDVARQLASRTHTVEQFSSGVQRFVIGLAKKILLANNIGKLWDIYSAMPADERSFIGAWLGILAFTLQIYFDFSGYSDMAIGLGRMIGFEFLENFNYPYIAKSVSEFWRRWHMSLGQWFRDYIYIPLGGNRCSLHRQILNLLVVWGLTGIWHGADWTFLLWGLYYAFFIILEKIFLLHILDRIHPLWSHAYTVLVVVFGWVLFQLNTVSECLMYWKNMIGIQGAGILSGVDLYYLKNYAILFILAILASTQLGAKCYRKLSPRVQGMVAPLLILLAMIIATGYIIDASYSPFLYFRF